MASVANSIAAIKSSVYSLQLSLLDGISSEVKLHAAGKVLTQSEYADVVTERSIVHMCGYPLCTNPLPSTFLHKGRYHISLREHKVYDLQETRLFCSSDCLVSSKSFAASLSLEREHSEKTLELVAAFHNLGREDANHEQANSLAPEKVLKEEDHQDAPASVSHQELNVHVSEDMATQQPQQRKSDNLLIREQKEIEFTDFSTAGPPEAIEGYVPQREFRPSHHKQATEQIKNHTQTWDSGLDSKDRTSDNLKKAKSKKKAAASPNKINKSSRASANTETEFTSCVLVNQGEPVMLNGANCMIESASSHNASSKGSMTHRAMNEEVSMEKTGQRQKKNQNRVSWADNNNLNLVEDLYSPGTASSTTVLNERIHSKEGDQVAAISTLGKVEVAVEGSSELLQRQENIFTGEEQENVQDADCRNDNLEHAKALVAALTEAAEAVALGGVDSTEAVARAGISILSKYEEPVSCPLDCNINERKDLDKELGNDVENIDPRECWYSAPPKDFKPELSTFGTLWMALDGWISSASIAHVYGRDSDEEDNFAVINGKEYLRQMIIPNGVSAEIERTLAGCISRALPVLVETLRFPVPVSTLEVSLGRFLRTMTFMTAIPAFSSKQWQVMVLLLLDALSVHRLPALRTRFLNGRQLVQKVLASAKVTEAEYEVFRDLVLPLGMLPDFATRCGG